MYNNGGPPVAVGTGLAATGVSSLQIVGLAIVSITFCVMGLLLIRSARLRAQQRNDGAV